MLAAAVAAAAAAAAAVVVYCKITLIQTRLQYISVGYRTSPKLMINIHTLF
jgi:hypothetical protein